MSTKNNYKLATDNGRYVSVPIEDIQIQEGQMYRVVGKVTNLGIGATHTIHIKTPADIFTFIDEIRVTLGDGPVDIVLRENPTITDGSTQVPIRNSNRTVTDTAQAIVYNDSSEISGGTELERLFVPTGKDQAFIMEDGRWVLKDDADYIVQIVNNSGQQLTFSYVITYHEHN